MNRQVKRWTLIGVSALVVVGMAVLFLFLWHRSCTFDTHRWRRGNESTRSAMVDDLISKKLLIGRSELELRATLGHPDNIQEDASSKTYEYDLGSEGGIFGIDHEWLVVEVKDGTAVRQFRAHD